jgi:hypothetical protein
LDCDACRERLFMAWDLKQIAGEDGIKEIKIYLYDQRREERMSKAWARLVKLSWPLLLVKPK